jgi:TPR repeat protein
MWKSQVNQRRKSVAELKAEALLAKPLSASTNCEGRLAQVNAMTIEFRRQRERKKKHNRARVKDLTYRPLSAQFHTGNPSFRLGMLMSNGTILPNGVSGIGFGKFDGHGGFQRDDEHASILFKHAAKIGHTGSQTALGEFYNAGRARDRYGTSLDRPKMKKAMIQFKMAAKKGDPSAALRMGLCLENTDMWEARRYYLIAAKAGLVDAQFNLGMLNQKLANYNESREYLLLASKQNHSGALTNLGINYIEGRGCQKDFIRAKQYFKRAAELGDAYGYYNLGLVETMLAKKEEEILLKQLQQKQQITFTPKTGRIPENILHNMICKRKPGWVKNAYDNKKEREEWNKYVIEKRNITSRNDFKINTIKNNISDHYETAEKCFQEAANRGHIKSMMSYGLSLVRRGLQRDGYLLMQKSQSLMDRKDGKENELKPPPSIVSPRNSAIDYNALNGSILSSCIMSASSFEQRPSTALSSHPLHHSSLENIEEKITITSPKHHLLKHHRSYWKKERTHDGLHLELSDFETGVDNCSQRTQRPQTACLMGKHHHQKHLDVLRPQSAAYFWGSKATTTTASLPVLSMTSRVSRPIKINEGKYIIPSSNIFKNERKEGEVQSKRKMSPNEVIQFVERNILNATNKCWGEILYELKALCIERGIDTSTKGIYNNPKYKATLLRERILNFAATEKRNLISKIKKDAAKMTGSTAQEKAKLGLKLTSYERLILSSK